MANEDLRVRITAQIQGLDAVESLKNAVRQLQTSAAPASADLQKLKNAAMQLGGAADRTENDLRRSINALKDVRAQLAVTGTEYKNLTKTINEYQKALDKATGAQRGGGGSRTGQAIGAIASGAIFGGPEGLLGGLGGAALGAAAGGGAVAGAFAGAAVGATAGMLRQQLTGAADYSAELNRLRIALKGVSTDQTEFNKSLSFIERTAPQFLMSIGDATKNYTRLQASVRGAGMGVDDTQKVFRGLSAAIVATGGGTEQLNGAMLAATQVFSKGKVSAEELRGQIGERLPGAFSLFAQAVDMTPQQLDKALEEGKVGLDDFIKFSEELFKRYGESAKAIGDSPFAASVRFQIAMDNMRLAAGNALLPITSFFQNLGAEALNSLTRILEGQTKWQQSIFDTFNAIGKLIGGVEGLNRILGGLIKTMIVLGSVQASLFVVSNLTAFSNGIKSIIGFTRTFLELSKSLLKVETARAAINAILTGVTTGASRGRIAGALLGGGVGLLAIAGLGKAIDSLVESVTSSVEKATKMPELGGTFGGQAQTLPQSTNPADAKETERARKQAIRDQAELNRLLQEQLKLNSEAGVVGKSDLEKLDAEAILLKQITRLRIDEAKLTSENEKIRQQRIINITAEYQKEKARIEEERRRALGEIQDLGKEADALIGKFSQRSVKTESPLTKELQSVDNTIQDAVKNTDKLLERLGKLGGTTPQTGALRARLGNFRESQLSMSEEERRRLATSNLLTPDILELQKQIGTLQLYGRELSTLEQLKQKYLADWDKLDPILRQQLETLAAQKDALERNAKLVDGIVNPLGQGLTSVFDALINGTQNWGNSLREIAATVLKDIAAQLIRILVIEQAITAIRGVVGGLFGGGSNATLPAAPVYAANGYAFAQNGIQPFAMGGIVNKPTLFKFANGGVPSLGVMGEAGPEAIMPLRRGRDGKLGVVANGGGGGVTVNVSVDASGSQVQSDAGRSEQLGRAVAQAVQQELVRQKRPGGLLAA